MIHDFDDFCLWMYVLVDDIWQSIAWQFERPEPAPQCSDSELITMAIVGECRGWDVETEMLSQWREHQDLFPHIPSQSRFNRRRRQLMYGINLIRQVVLQGLDVAHDRQAVIDSLPIPVVQFHLVPGSTGDWAAHGAAFGKVPAKNQTLYGYKLHLLITLGGVILDFELAPAVLVYIAVCFGKIAAKHGKNPILYGMLSLISPASHVRAASGGGRPSLPSAAPAGDAYVMPPARNLLQASTRRNS